MGVTGTNGKTTTTAMVASALAQHTRPVPRVTTVGNYLDDERLDVAADFDGFVETMRRGRDEGARFAAIELSSEALALGFMRRWPCQIGVFTNLSHDHLSSHRSAEHYLASKAQLFAQLPVEGAAILNGCDEATPLMVEIVPPGVRVLHYGLESRGLASFALAVTGDVDVSWRGTRVRLSGSGELDFGGVNDLTTRAIGAVFAEKALAAWLTALALDVPAAAAARAIAAMAAPAGRFEVVLANPHVVVDYAHTPDALRRAVATAHELCEGSVWLVFGAGGDRDREKRPAMGRAAAAADHVVITSDNPRNEDPVTIAASLASGVGAHASVHIELDRRRAIHDAIRGAAKRDVVVIAGKGHERTQQIGAHAHPFSDREVVLAAGSG